MLCMRKYEQRSTGNLPVVVVNLLQRWRAKSLLANMAAGMRYDSGDRKSTRLNSSHVAISYAVFCLKKKSTIPPTGGGNSDRRLATLAGATCPHDATAE